MDKIILMLLIFYSGQTIDVFIRKALDKKKPIWILILPAFALISYFLNATFFIFVLLFIAVFWSHVCRSSDYGISYHFTLIVGTGIALGPLAGIFIGLVPFFLVPYIRPDCRIISLSVDAILLGIIGAIGGLLGTFSQAYWIYYSLVLLVVYIVIRFIFLFGKTTMPQLSAQTVVSLGINYYLINAYLLALTVLILS